MTRSSGRLFAFFLAASILISSAASAWAADPALLLPLNRTAYQTNERIDLAVVRSSDKELAAGELTLTVSGDDGSKLVFTYPVKAAAVSGKDARTTEHLYLNAWLLRPGKYSLEAAVDGGVGKATIDVYNHVRKSDFKLVNWGRAKDVADQLPQGEDSIGFNLFYGHYGNDDQAGFIRAGVDFMSCCTMSGAHQMDIRSECDWSDPYVTRGGTVRVVRRAFQDRTRGNVPGVHFYDEPGLTWSKDPKSGEMTPHAVPAQAWSYEAAFGKAPLRYTDVDPKNPDHIARWEHWARWKLSFMDAAWKEAQFGVSQVRPDMISLTQSQYGYSAFTDGYYFNVARSLPITSGHGGYDDYGPGYFNPGYTMEIARARDFWKANWYLPTWYGNTTTDTFRLEQYLSFQTNIQGMLSPPDIDPFVGNQQKPAAQGVVESNHLMMKLGPIFNQIPVNKMPVALLYSVSNCIRAQTADMKANYAHSMPHGEGLPLVYLAGKVIQQPFTTVVEEDILDGTLAQDHKAVVLNAINYLDPKVVTALEQYIATGGAVLMTSDSKVEIKGAIKVPTVARMPDQEIIDQLSKEKKYKEMAPYTTSGKHIEAAIKIGAAFKAEFDKLGLKPVFETDNQAIIASRQAAGDIEYIFAVNATYDNESNGAKNAVKAASATISLADDSRPVYDAVTGGIVPQFQKAGGKLTGSFRFGAGQMRVFARPARTIGSVSAGAPVVVRELALEKSPVRLDLSASVADEKGKLLSGSVPVHIRVVDPLGATRHELFRATKQGVLNVSVPLAANDPAGQWTVLVRELLNNTEDKSTFAYTPSPRNAAVSGAAHRAIYVQNDLDNIFRFARLHQDVTIVGGSSSFAEPAAKRLISILEPWGVRCQYMDVAAASKTRELSEKEAATWVGLQFGKAKAGAGNKPEMSGFAVQGPVILLGNPEDNAIIKYLSEQKYLPYKPDPLSMPGRGRALLAWQRDGVGKGQESVTLIAYDDAGLQEAVGSFYEAVAGLDPLTKWALPLNASVAPAKSAPGLAPAAGTLWTATLVDRVDGIKVSGDSLSVLTHDGSLATVDASGKVGAAKVLTGAELEAARKELATPVDAAAKKTYARPDRVFKFSAANGGKVAVAYWGGTLRVMDGANVKSEQRLPQDITALAWLNDKLIAGLADGRVVALDAK